ncbi:MAG: arsenate reductase ArsC [Actinomycetota bacterium]
MSDALTPNRPAVLARIAEDLAARHRGVVTREEVEDLLQDSYDRLAGTATLTTYLPVLARHFAETRIVDLAHARGQSGRAVPKVVFLCVHNAGRSQMAAALLEHHAAGRVDVRSAGSQPAGELNPSAVAALAEIGIDLRTAYPKPITDEVIRAADVVVTMGCGDSCPVVAGTRYLDWDLPDPADLPLEAVRPIRDQLDERVRGLLEELTD